MDNKNKIIKIILTVLGVIISLKILKFIFSMAFALLIPILIGGGLIIIPILFLLVPIAILCAIMYLIYKFFVKERSVW
ncbi:MAG: hypothetical protein E7E32_04835 [Anaerococcus hydrogenalis]|nr:hypothetical protein [Anaerococcus hydrogenalis]